jgi:hypothetical protein
MYLRNNIDEKSEFFKQITIKLKAWFNITPMDFPNILKAAGVDGVTCVMQEPDFEKFGPGFFRVILTVTAPEVHTYCLEVRHSPRDEFEAEFILTDNRETIRFYPKISYTIEGKIVYPPDKFINAKIDAMINPSKKRRFF